MIICDGATAIFAPGATLNDGNVLIVGNDAAGSLLAMDGGSTRAILNTVDANLGKHDDGIGTVTINDAIWNNSGHAFIGDAGAATLKVVDNGSVIFGGGVEMAADPGSAGTMTIDGGSVLVAAALRIGGASTTLAGVASVSVGSGGSLTVDDALAVGGGSTLTVDGGTITAAVSADCMRTLAGGIISGHGTLTAPVLEDDGSVVASGGDLRIEGNVVGTGSLQIAAHSTTAIDGVGVKVAGIAFLGSGSTLSLVSGADVTAAISGFAIGDISRWPVSTPCRSTRQSAG